MGVHTFKNILEIMSKKTFVRISNNRVYEHRLISQAPVFLILLFLIEALIKPTYNYFRVAFSTHLIY